MEGGKPRIEATLPLLLPFRVKLAKPLPPYDCKLFPTTICKNFFGFFVGVDFLVKTKKLL